MHSVSRSMVASVPGARRISRWHPYHQQPVATPSTVSSDGATTHAPLFLSKRCTLSSSVYAPSPVQCPALPTGTPSFDTSEPAESPAHPSRILAPEDRAVYARCLVDRAVKILTQKWMPVAYSPFPHVIAKDATVVANANSSHMAPLPTESHLARYPYQSTAEHMPLRQFMHEVLRRSRTSCTSLQTALCYVEAVAVKLPSLVREEVRRIDQQNATPTHNGNASADAVSASSDDQIEHASGSIAPAAESPSLPSPLLCPRRTFLASLLLASKFLQDRSYSNKAWGKLTGLAPREVGRCERALSEALEWRLWVGKGQDSMFPMDFMDDGGPVVPADAVYQPADATPPPPPLPTLPILASIAPQPAPVAGPSRLRRARTEPTLDLPRAAARRLGPAATWGPHRFAAGPSFAASSSRSRTESWVQDVAAPAHLSALEAPTPHLPSPLANFTVNDATFVESLSMSSLSPPGSLVYTQSSAASFASFPDIATPPNGIVNIDMAPLKRASPQGNVAVVGSEAEILSDLHLLRDLTGLSDWA